MNALHRTILLLLVVVLIQPSEGYSEYPEKPIKIIVPFAPGGMNDTFCRYFQKAMSDIIPQPIVVINMGGAGGMIGSRYVKDAKPDGYTILSIHPALIIAHALGTVDFSYTDFEPVAQIGSTFLGLVVQHASPCTSFIDLADRTGSQTLTMSTNIGAVAHFGGLALADAADIAFRFVHSGGGAKRIASLLGGHTQCGMLAVPEFKQYVQSGAMRVLTILSDNRHPDFPAVPTTAELGYPTQIDVSLWFFAPEGTPAARVHYIADAFERALQQSGLQQQYKDQSMLPVFLKGVMFEEKLHRTAAYIQAMVETHDMRQE